MNSHIAIREMVRKSKNIFPNQVAGLIMWKRHAWFPHIWLCWSCVDCWSCVEYPKRWSFFPKRYIIMPNRYKNNTNRQNIALIDAMFFRNGTSRPWPSRSAPTSTCLWPISAHVHMRSVWLRKYTWSVSSHTTTYELGKLSHDQQWSGSWI